MQNELFKGSLTVGLSYVIWGLLPFFWNFLSDVNPVYILAHRIIWSMVFIGIIILISKNTTEIKNAFHDRNKILICVITGILVSVNWGTYIYAITCNHVIDASLGYFIEPIIVSLMGLIVFKEKLSFLEKITFCFAVIGLVYMVITTKTMPTLALVIAGSFAVYGAVKKQLPLSAQASLFLETLMMTPIALAFALYADFSGWEGIRMLNGGALLLLPICGIVTSVPLLIYNIGVKEIPYYFSGILMYINPTLVFITGLLFFNEALDVHKLIAFIIIWIGILFTVTDKLLLIRRDLKQRSKN